MMRRTSFLAAVALTTALVGCSSGGGKDTGLDATAVAELTDTAELVAAVAADGVRPDGARAAAVLVARDAVAFTEAVEEHPPVAREFLREVLDADPTRLPVLIAAALDGLVGGVHEAAVAMSGLDPALTGPLDNQRLFLRTGAAHSDDVFHALGSAAEDAGIDDEVRWAALLGVLDAARATGAATGSFVVELDDAALDGLAPGPDPPELPEDDAGFDAVAERPLVELLVDALHADPDVRNLVTGDEDIDRDAFADDPFVNALIHVQGVGTRSLRATSELLDLR